VEKTGGTMTVLEDLKTDSMVVERRKESRIVANSPTLVSVLGVDGHLPIPGLVLDLSSSALKIAVPVAIPCGALVKAEAFETLLLGEVCRCEQAADGFQVVLQVSHSLNSLSELERLNTALWGQDQVKTIRHSTARELVHSYR
jgi:hypothetical protein